MTLRLLTSGESHGPALVAVLEGFPAGMQINTDQINRELSRRQKGFGSGDRMKIENDEAVILGGVMGGETTGAPISVLIENKDHINWQGKEIEAMTAPRPGHADLTGTAKYGYGDLRKSLERASARETAAKVAVGAICKLFLSHFGISINGYVVEIGGIRANLDELPFAERAALAEMNTLRCPDLQVIDKMKEKIQLAIEKQDTLGGVIELCGLNLPVGLGSHVHWDRKIESRLGAAILGVQAMKGVEFGNAFENSKRSSTQVQDPILGGKNDIFRPTNNAGGIEGGITNGEPLIIRAAMKPIPSTLTSQKTVDLLTGEAINTQYHRSDHCPVPRAVPVLEAAAILVLADALIEKLGGDSIAEMQPRFDNLRKMRFSDFELDGTDRVWWPK
ncbi:MAG: chorismate synthase [Anaerolineaceae bacterium]|nr:chorismate synthase [Anaerolineaceae bacterium]